MLTQVTLSMTHTRVEDQTIWEKTPKILMEIMLRINLNLLLKNKELAVVFESRINRSDKFETPKNKDSLIASPGISKLNINKLNLDGWRLLNLEYIRKPSVTMNPLDSMSNFKSNTKLPVLLSPTQKNIQNNQVRKMAGYSRKRNVLARRCLDASS